MGLCLLNPPRPRFFAAKTTKMEKCGIPWTENRSGREREEPAHSQPEAGEILGDGVPTCGFEQTLEEALVVDPGHAADLGHLRLFHCAAIHKVDRDANGQLATHFSHCEA